MEKQPKIIKESEIIDPITISKTRYTALVNEIKRADKAEADAGHLREALSKAYKRYDDFDTEMRLMVQEKEDGLTESRKKIESLEQQLAESKTLSNDLMCKNSNLSDELADEKLGRSLLAKAKDRQVELHTEVNELKQANASANKLIGSQAEENAGIIQRLKAELENARLVCRLCNGKGFFSGLGKCNLCEGTGYTDQKDRTSKLKAQLADVTSELDKCKDGALINRTVRTLADENRSLRQRFGDALNVLAWYARNSLTKGSKSKAQSFLDKTK